MNVMFAGYAAAHEYFARGGAQFGDNIRRYHDRLRRANLLPHPHPRASSAGPRDGCAGGHRGGERGARRPGDGRRCGDPRRRMLATLAPFADELAVVPSVSPLPARHRGGQAVRLRLLHPDGHAGAPLHLPQVTHATGGERRRLSPVGPHGRDGLRGRLRRRARAVGALLHLPQSAPRGRHHGGGPRAHPRAVGHQGSRQGGIPARPRLQPRGVDQRACSSPTCRTIFAR